MRDDRRDNYNYGNFNRDNDRNRNDRNRDMEPRWAHGHHHGQNSDRGNYVRDSHFNRGYGDNANSQYGDTNSFNSNADQSQMYPQGRFQAGGATYAGDDYTRGNRGSFSEDNPFGMTYIGDEGLNAGKKYDPNVDYSDRDYDDLRQKGRPDYRYGLADERFGHDVRRGQDESNWSRGSRSDYESYRRYEHDNDMYDNDYSSSYGARNYSRDVPHYGEGQYYSNMERWDRDNRRFGRPDDRDRNIRNRDERR
ncbi:hypothetical protein CLV24_10295 [Pontibacter ummariensis]|uniref:Uncharacterized protein n=1 Tax=Pontibacter ummariensis TaxID=1610492 RepID=A0A239C5B7_9BACT|nr:hypothetical protein [Pontibacter ummariensis]PRY15474.1 hypothetical protein CLV24_10295 [Pontibacter ummariensis]SNS14614.1 hypothetical protein SAMN06296052_102318 [Pontibacter ummariensis]